MKNKKVKGFTLVELIVVTAIFGIIMAAALGLLSPVQKQFIRTAEYEGARAGVDNVNRYVTGTLRYVDRAWVYYGSDYVAPDNSIAITTIDNAVTDFANNYFLNNCTIDAESINVLAFDNENGVVHSYTYPDIKSQSGGYDVLSLDVTKRVENDAINEALSNEYKFTYYLGEYDYQHDIATDSYTLMPLNNGITNSKKIAVSIDISKKNANGTLNNLQQCSVVSFAPVNLSKVSPSESPYRHLLDGGAWAVDTNGNYVYEQIPAISTFKFNSNAISGTTPDIDSSFFIIYTLPKKY